jgi:hypothetical protein
MAVGPEFSSKTRDALGKRAAFLCSNPECRVSTSGPSQTAAEKATIIGEAAHIHGALPAAARFRIDLSDEARADITNGLWLCRNCHKIIDDDPHLYPADMLFRWQEEHREYVVGLLGKPNDRIRLDIAKQELDSLGPIPPLARSIIVERQDGWEYRLTHELLEFYLRPAKQQWDELNSGFYTKKLRSMDEVDYERWFSAALADIQTIMPSLEKLLPNIVTALGPKGVEGNPQEINRACKLLGQAATRLIEWEEEIAFVDPPEYWDDAHALLKGAGGSQIGKILAVKTSIHQVVEWLESGQTGPKTIEHTVLIDLPANWERDMQKALTRAKRKKTSWWN